MVALNYSFDIDDMSDEAHEMASQGVVITKCYRAMKGIHLKVTTRLDFDEACDLVRWYVSERKLGVIVNINIGDYVRRGDLLFTITAGH